MKRYKNEIQDLINAISYFSTKSVRARGNRLVTHLSNAFDSLKKNASTTGRLQPAC